MGRRHESRRHALRAPSTPQRFASAAESDRHYSQQEEEEWRRFDFVEVGTSDFRTLTQFLDGTDRSCPMGHALCTWNPEEVVGLAVEPVWHLLNRLPNLVGVQKVHAAIGRDDAQRTLWYAKEDALQRFPGAYSAWLARGTATLGDPHPKLMQWLARERIDPTQIMTQQLVPVWSFKTLATTYKVLSIDVLKTDCEGADCEVLRGLIDYCDQRPETFPRIIAFESNDMTRPETVQEIIRELVDRGYKVLSQGHDTILKRTRDQHPLVCCAFLRGVCPWGTSCFFDHQSSQDAMQGCCFQSCCVHGHGGAVPRCCRCGERFEGSPRGWCYCRDCWSRVVHAASVKERCEANYEPPPSTVTRPETLARAPAHHAPRPPPVQRQGFGVARPARLPLPA